MGKHHEIRTGRSGGGSARLHAVVEHDVGHPSWQTWQIWRGLLGPQASSIFFSVAGDTHLCRWWSATGSPQSISGPSSIGSGCSWSCDLEMVIQVWSERIQQCKWLYTEVLPAYTAWPVFCLVRHSWDLINEQLIKSTHCYGRPLGSQSQCTSHHYFHYRISSSLTGTVRADWCSLFLVPKT